MQAVAQLLFTAFIQISRERKQQTEQKYIYIPPVSWGGGGRNISYRVDDKQGADKIFVTVKVISTIKNCIYV